MAVGRGFKPIKSGMPLTADNLTNKLGRGVQRGNQVSGRADTYRYPDGVGVDIPDSATNTQHGVIVRWAEIVDVFPNYLECVFYNPADGTTRGGNFYVAKPFELQADTLDGAVITYIDGEEITYTADGTNPEYKRNHDDGLDSADFVVTPNYYIGQPILIIRVPTNLQVGQTPIVWMEMNTTGRYWARVE